MTEKKKFTWAEKYAPEKLDDCVLPSNIKNLFGGYVAKGDIPNLLFSGKPGIGKTTIAHVLCNELNLLPLFINGSKDSGIDVLRTTIERFASTKGLDDRKKLVILDEADYLNPNSTQPALRGFIDKFQSNTRFLFTVNYKQKLLEPLASRCVVVDFGVPKDERKEMLKGTLRRVKNILDNEKVKYNPNVLLEIVKRFFPDHRRMVNELQAFDNTHGEISSGVLSASVDLNMAELFGFMKEKNYGEVRTWVTNSVDTDHTKIYTKLSDAAVQYLTKESVPETNKTLARYQYMAAFAADQELNLLACLTEIMFDSEYKE